MNARTIPLLAVAALLVFAQAATAQVLRPTMTTGVNGWTTVPYGTGIAAALADDVTQPAAPNTGTGYVTSPTGGNYWTAVTVAAPVLAPAESITGATAWAYVASGSTRSALLALYSGQTLLGWTVVPAGQSARWFSVSSTTVPTAAQAANLYVVLVPSGKTSTAVTAYAAYVDLATVAPDHGTTPVSPGGSSPTATGGGGGGDATAGGAPTPASAGLAPVAALTVKPTGVVNVPVSCPAISVFGCTGTVTVELLGKPSHKGASRATTARRRKVVLRAKGRRFKLAAGANAMVPVVLDRRTARLLRHSGRARARVTVTTEIGGGKKAVSSQTVTLRERRTVRRPAKNTPRGGNGH